MYVYKCRLPVALKNFHEIASCRHAHAERIASTASRRWRLSISPPRHRDGILLSTDRHAGLEDHEVSVRRRAAALAAATEACRFFWMARSRASGVSEILLGRFATFHPKSTPPFCQTVLTNVVVLEEPAGSKLHLQRRSID